MQLIYSSRPFGFDGPTLIHILAVSRRNNERDGVTGALFCRDDLFLQLLEGPAGKVKAAFARIARDDRHVEVEKRWQDEHDQRLFPGWAMYHDPASFPLWSREEVLAGAMDQAAPDEWLAIFQRSARA